MDPFQTKLDAVYQLAQGLGVISFIALGLLCAGLLLLFIFARGLRHCLEELRLTANEPFGQGLLLGLSASLLSLIDYFASDRVQHLLAAIRLIALLLFGSFFILRKLIFRLKNGGFTKTP